MEPEDVAVAAGIVVAAWRSSYRGLIADAAIDAQTEGAHTAALGAMIPPEDPTILLVAEDRTVVAGFAVAAASRDEDALPGEGELWGIYVHPDRQGSGIGTALMRAALDHLRRRGFTQAILWMLAGNRAADGFYRACGWSPDGGRRTEHTRTGHPLPEVRYRIRLG
jgi:GNAT superfamily N-acetyltransferase